MENKELETENIYLNDTLSIINQKIKSIEDVLSEKVDDIEQFKRELQISKREMDKSEFDSNVEHVNKSVNVANESFKKLNQLIRSSNNPYFGRIDFIDEENTQEKIYIGLCGIDEDFKFYIYDWRTPIASMFYNYGVGRASYVSPEGEISGEIELKRQFKFENGEIKHYFDTSINIDDPFLQDVLASSSNEKMKNIVTTIQQEQNAVIRNTSDKILIVQGSAGSGKTSVALHRIAYLLYQNKELTSNNIIIFSPNDVFSNYISDVLPELGENNVIEMTFSDFAKRHLQGFKKLENYMEFSERYYKSEKFDKNDFLQIKSKLSDELPEFITEYLNEIAHSIDFNEDLVLNRKNLNIVGFEEIIIPKEELRTMFRDRYSKVDLMERLDCIAINISDSLGISYKKYSRIIKKKLKDIVNRKIEIKSIYNEIISSDKFFNKFRIRGTKIPSNCELLKYEDILPLLYVTFEMNGYPSESYIKQIVIDEAQDYTKLQFKMISKIFSFADFTILGDVNQTINPFYKYSKLDNINDCFKGKTNYIELNKTYRSSYEIVEHNNKILGLTNSLAVRKNSNENVLYKKDSFENNFTCIYKDIVEMKKNGMKKIAVITKNYVEANQIYEQLNPKTNIQLVSAEEIRDLLVLPVSIAKGLEFDGVIVYSDEKNKYSDADKNLFYVACTRAQHKLIIYNQDINNFTSNDKTLSATI